MAASAVVRVRVGSCPPRSPGWRPSPHRHIPAGDRDSIEGASVSRWRLGLGVGVGISATIVAFLCVPGHPLGTFLYNHAPSLFRQMVIWEQSSNALQQQNGQELWSEIQTHLQVSAIAAGFAIGIAFPLGVVASRERHIRSFATNLVGVARSVPGVAVIFLMYPYLGQGDVPGILALTVLALPPIFLNTVAGYGSVDRAVVESARGMGMSRLQVFARIETPLAAAIVVAGMRIALVEILASATILAFSANVSTLGTQISYGLDNYGGTSYCGSAGCSPFFSGGARLVHDGQVEMALGVVLIAVMALTAEFMLTLLQRAVAPARR
jgi:osmoprotectant transport system permease protein